MQSWVGSAAARRIQSKWGHDANSEGFNKVAMLRAVDRPKERDSNDLRAINDQEVRRGPYDGDV